MYLNRDFKNKDDDHIYNILISVFHITDVENQPMSLPRGRGGRLY